MKRNKGKSSQKPLVKKTFPGWVWGLIILAGVLLAGFAIFQLVKPTEAAYPDELTVAQAAEKREQGAFILDVRQQEEWQQFHIPGATLIPLGELQNRLNEVPKARGVVVVCRSGNRSQQGRDILRSAGFTQVTSMAGGVTEWQALGLPIASGQ